ncbi:MAG TPA: radical SAM family heme chaperone HemW [Candidatus Eisenbacteria bacterium]|nr:radical SAM family heme chaperone HemW [Candidatus Eisenbacteria bacterium]
MWRSGDAPLGLYVHVPFCRALCSYCTFAKGLYDEKAAWSWLRGIEREITVRANRTWEARALLDTLFLGGGTPSSLTPDQWQRLGELLERSFERTPGIEFTAEANPESFLPEIADAMRRAGVNRVSFGAQSFDPEELGLLNRVHDASAIGRAVKTARQAGFTNVSLDLMYGLPGQTVPTFESSIEAAIALEPDHLSAYCLSLEPGTPLTDAVGSGREPKPDGDRAAEMYEALVRRLAESGYALYEISNFARPGRESRHNLRYWRREDVIALGPSAHALLGGRRWANPAPLEAWIRAYMDPVQAPRPRAVPLPEARFEWLFLRLRLREGFSRTAYASAWGERFEDRYESVASRLIEAGWLEEFEGAMRLTSKARFLSDGVFAEFAP